MAITNAKQLLNNEELCNKLGGSSSSATILNAGQISSTWGNGVYILNNVSGKCIPNNGEVWPVRTYKFGNQIAAAISGNNKTINIRDASWDSSTPFDINIEGGGSTYFYENTSIATQGYYVDSGNNSSGYHYYQVNNSGRVTAEGTYYPHSFAWNSTGADGWVTVTMPGSAGFTTRETISSSFLKYKGNLSGSKTSDSSLSVSQSNNTVSISRSSIDSNYPFSLAVMSGTQNSLTYRHGILGVPENSFWTVSANNITNIGNGYQQSISPSVTTNMGSYTLSKAGNESWVNINSNNTTLEVMGNGTYDSRSATINVTADVGTITFSGVHSDLESVSYTGPSKSTSFTITQNGMPKPQLAVVWFPTHNTGRMYVVSYSTPFSLDWDDLNSYLVDAPAQINIGTYSAKMVIRTGLTQTSAPDAMNYVEYSLYGTIRANSSNVLVKWVQENYGGSACYYEKGERVSGTKALSSTITSYTINTYPTISWKGTAPSGWTLHNTLEVC